MARFKDHPLITHSSAINGDAALWKWECLEDNADLKDQALMMQHPDAERKFEGVSKTELGGKVSDASDPSNVLEGATVTLTYSHKSKAKKPRTAETDHEGRFLFKNVFLDVEATLKASMKGYSDAEKVFMFDMKTSPGGPADISMSKELANTNDQRFVLTWEDTADVDIEV